MGDDFGRQRVVDRTDRDDARVVDEHVQAACAADHLADESLRVRWQRHVAHDGPDVGAACVEILARPLELGSIARRQCQQRAFLGSWRATTSPSPRDPPVMITDCPAKSRRLVARRV